MKTRSLTAIFITAVYVLVLLLTVFVHKIFFDVFVLLLMIISSMELSKALAKKFSKPIDIFIVLYCVLGYLTFYIVNYVFKRDSGISAYFAVLAFMFILSTVVSMFSKKITMRNVISTMLVMIYPVTLLVYMLGLNYIPNENFNIAAIFLMVLVSSLTDTFAYLVGVTLRGPKLCPNISPKKTISGALGGVLGGMLGAAIVLGMSVLGWLNVPVLSASTAFNIIHYLVLGLIGSVFTQVGDLIASYIKRQCEIKDFSKILPGHGGIMDRIDGFMLNAVFIYIYVLILVF